MHLEPWYWYRGSDADPGRSQQFQDQCQRIVLHADHIAWGKLEIFGAVALGLFNAALNDRGWTGVGRRADHIDLICKVGRQALGFRNRSQHSQLQSGWIFVRPGLSHESDDLDWQWIFSFDVDDIPVIQFE